MNRATMAEVEKIRRSIPPKNQFQTAHFTITKTEVGFEVEEIGTNDFSHLADAVRGDTKYIIAQNSEGFDTIEAAVSWLNTRMECYRHIKPCLALLGDFTPREMQELEKVEGV